MNEVTELSGIDWAALAETAKTTGIDFGINIVIAILIFMSAVQLHARCNAVFAK